MGRVAVSTPTGPRIVPVNYAVVDDAVVFRTTPYSVLGTYAWNTDLAFEVDHIDYENHQGWSVVATGRGIDGGGQGRAGQDPVLLGSPALGRRAAPALRRLRWDELTGRQIGAGWTYANEMPVRRVV